MKAALSLIALSIALAGCSSIPKEQPMTASWVQPVQHKVYPESHPFTQPLFTYRNSEVAVVVPGRKVVQEPERVVVAVKPQESTETVIPVAPTEPVAMTTNTDLLELKRQIAELEQTQAMLMSILERQLANNQVAQDLGAAKQVAEVRLVKVNAVQPRVAPEIIVNRKPAQIKFIKASIEPVASESKLDAVFNEGSSNEVVDIVSVFDSKEDAEALAKQLKTKGDNDFFISNSRNKNEWYVYLGRFNNAPDTAKRLETLASYDIASLALISKRGRYQVKDYV